MRGSGETPLLRVMMISCEAGGLHWRDPAIVREIGNVFQKMAIVTITKSCAIHVFFEYRAMSSLLI